MESLRLSMASVLAPAVACFHPHLPRGLMEQSSLSLPLSPPPHSPSQFFPYLSTSHSFLTSPETHRRKRLDCGSRCSQTAALHSTVMHSSSSSSSSSPSWLLPPLSSRRQVIVAEKRRDSPLRSHRTCATQSHQCCSTHEREQTQEQADG